MNQNIVSVLGNSFKNSVIHELHVSQVVYGAYVQKILQVENSVIANSFKSISGCPSQYLHTWLYISIIYLLLNPMPRVLLGQN